LSETKQEDAVSPLLLNFPLEYIIKKVQTNQEGLKSPSVYDDDNLLGKNIHTAIKK
jgi:hypothetical protein